MPDRLDGIHALVTGAASGIGAACARRMARDGAHLLLADLNGDGANSLADELGQAFIQADVTRATDVQRMLDMAYDRWGRLDVLFNNAGIAQVRQLLELTEDDWDRTLAVNLRAVFFVLQGAARRMRHQTPIAASELRGKLIQTASISAYRGWSGAHGPLRREQSWGCQRHTYCSAGVGAVQDHFELHLPWCGGHADVDED
jgi:meso-butanediol dehydrogenase/(S,S)-butanediol dehydrogenase/diacetyl reductase